MRIDKFAEEKQIELGRKAARTPMSAEARVWHGGYENGVRDGIIVGTEKMYEDAVMLAKKLAKGQISVEGFKKALRS